LCQILRHETTAAYFVCSAADDPACAVALDACSDYQRNGTVFLSAEMLLEYLRPLAWGGYGLSLTAELLYRFAKAAAKNKEPALCAAEFATYPEYAREECVRWLDDRWNISLKSWTSADLATALSEFRQQSRSRPSLLQISTLSRLLSRITQPTGLVAVIGQDNFAIRSSDLSAIFGHLYFRRVRIEENLKSSHLGAVAASTLVIVPAMSPPLKLLLPKNCLIRLNSGDPSGGTPISVEELAVFLHSRLARQIIRPSSKQAP
jgi:hypothetical protein